MKQRIPVIRFHIVQSFTLKERIKLKDAIRGIFLKEGKHLASLDYIFCSEQYLLDINKQYLKHSTHTDIITFDLSEGPGPITGEIYISIPRVKENSLVFRVPFGEELRRVMFHGALHLCGFKDKKAGDIKVMRKKEDYYLKKFNVSRVTVSH